TPSSPAARSTPTSAPASAATSSGPPATSPNTADSAAAEHLGGHGGVGEVPEEEPLTVAEGDDVGEVGVETSARLVRLEPLVAPHGEVVAVGDEELRFHLLHGDGSAHPGEEVDQAVDALVLTGVGNRLVAVVDDVDLGVDIGEDGLGVPLGNGLVDGLRGRDIAFGHRKPPGSSDAAPAGAARERG